MNVASSARRSVRFACWSKEYPTGTSAPTTERTPSSRSPSGPGTPPPLKCGVGRKAPAVGLFLAEAAVDDLAAAPDALGLEIDERGRDRGERVRLLADLCDRDPVPGVLGPEGGGVDGTSAPGEEYQGGGSQGCAGSGEGAVRGFHDAIVAGAGR